MKKFLFDLFPAIAFFIVFRWGESNPEVSLHFLENYFSWIMASTVKSSNAPVLLATVVVIVATGLQMLWLKLKQQKIETMLWASFIIVTVLGFATLLFNDEWFIKWKPTVLSLALALGLLISKVFFGKNVIYALIGSKLKMPQVAWNHLLWIWFFYFIVSALLNLWVAYNFSTKIWVDYKLFGSAGLMIVFVVFQGFYISRLLSKYSAEIGNER